jgi:hypothetical protein
MDGNTQQQQSRSAAKPMGCDGVGSTSLEHGTWQHRLPSILYNNSLTETKERDQDETFREHIVNDIQSHHLRSTLHYALCSSRSMCSYLQHEDVVPLTLNVGGIELTGRSGGKTSNAGARLTRSWFAKRSRRCSPDADLRGANVLCTTSVWPWWQKAH